MKYEIGRTPFRSGRFTAALLALAIGWVSTVAAQPRQRLYDTPKQAAEAAVAAAEKDDVAALLEIFGPDGKDLILSGDPVEDKNGRARFAAKAREKMQVTFDLADPTLATLTVGNDDWPFPVAHRAANQREVEIQFDARPEGSPRPEDRRQRARRDCAAAGLCGGPEGLRLEGA